MSCAGTSTELAFINDADHYDAAVQNHPFVRSQLRRDEWAGGESSSDRACSRPLIELFLQGREVAEPLWRHAQGTVEL